MVHKEKQSIMIQCAQFLKYPMLHSSDRSKQIQPQTFLQEGIDQTKTKNSTKKEKKHLLIFVSIATSSTMMTSSAKVFIG